MQEIWIEKYRPTTLKQVAGQPEVVERLQAYVKTKGLPHLLFAGPAGTGKTTCAIALAKQIFGDPWRDNFTELNASDERGIDVVRTKIKDFARTAPMGNLPYKIIFLDEADALTPDAQAALRRTMERFTRTCRFILSANYSSKIINPIQSRCAVYRFRPLRDADMRRYLKYIVEQEKLDYSKEALDAITYIAGGDMRKAISALQVAASLSKKIDAESIYKATATAKPEEIKKLLENALSSEFMSAREVLDKLLIEYGLSGEDIIRQIHRTLFELSIPEKAKVELVDRLGEAEFRVVEGANERIQLEALLARFALIGSKA